MNERNLNEKHVNKPMSKMIKEMENNDNESNDDSINDDCKINVSFTKVEFDHYILSDHVNTVKISRNFKKINHKLINIDCSSFENFVNKKHVTDTCSTISMLDVLFGVDIRRNILQYIHMAPLHVRNNKDELVKDKWSIHYRVHKASKLRNNILAKQKLILLNDVEFCKTFFAGYGTCIHKDWDNETFDYIKTTASCFVLKTYGEGVSITEKYRYGKRHIVRTVKKRDFYKMNAKGYSALLKNVQSALHAASVLKDKVTLENDFCRPGDYEMYDEEYVYG